MNSSLDILSDYYTLLKGQVYAQLKHFGIQIQEYDIIDVLSIYSLIVFFVYLVYSRVKCPRKNYNQSYGAYLKSYAFLTLVKYSPGLSGYIEKQKDKSLKGFADSIGKITQKKTFKLPENGMTQERLQERLAEWTQRDRALSYTGKVSGTLYISNDVKFETNVQEFTSNKSHILKKIENFIYSNQMHFDLFPAVRQMEAEVTRMTGDLFGQEKDSIGILTSGGTESILLAMLAYRNWGKEQRSIQHANIVIPETAHAAFYKAGEYFQIEMRIAKIDKKTYQVDVNDLKSKIDGNTVAIVGSFPNYPHGICDPIEQLAAIAKRKKIGFHVDCCLGGFVVVFAKDLGIDLGKYDFSIDGVTSISVDQHKYGLAPKGVSTVLFKSPQLRQYAFFGIATWSGGAYVSPSLSGSKTGVGAVGAWYVMQTTGKKRYIENSKLILETTQNLVKQLKEIPEVEVIGNPRICVVAFLSKQKWLNIYSVQSILSEKGWVISSTQKPAGIHITVTLQNAPLMKQFIHDVKHAIAEIKANPKQYTKGGEMGQLYGTTQAIPDGEFASDAIKSFLNIVLKV